MLSKRRGFLVSGPAPCNCSCLFDDFLSDSKQHFSKKLELLADNAVNAQKYDEAISEYSAALSLDPDAPQDRFIKRSKAYVALGSWADALDDANRVRCFVSCRLVLIDDITISSSSLMRRLHGATRGSTQLYTERGIMTMPYAHLR